MAVHSAIVRSWRRTRARIPVSSSTLRSPRYAIWSASAAVWSSEADGGPDPEVIGQLATLLGTIFVTFGLQIGEVQPVSTPGISFHGGPGLKILGQ